MRTSVELASEELLYHSYLSRDSTLSSLKSVATPNANFEVKMKMRTSVNADSVERINPQLHLKQSVWALMLQKTQSTIVAPLHVNAGYAEHRYQ